MADPHDILFHYTFSKPEHAAELLREQLPSALAARIDWSTLTPQPRSYVQAGEGWRHADLLFSVELDAQPAFIYLLIEHQSSRDPLMPFRMLRYTVRIWDDYVQAHRHTDRLPAILPLVVSHADRPWSAPTRLQDIIVLPSESRSAVVDLIPDFRFLLDDLTAHDERSLMARQLDAQAKLTLLALRHVRDTQRFVGALQQWAQLLRAVDARPHGRQPLIALFTYVLEVGDDAPEQLVDVLQSHLGTATTEAVMTTAERLIQRGIEKGREQGLLQGRQAALAGALVRLLEHKFGPLDEPFRQRLETAPIPQLEHHLDRVLTAERLEDVFEG